MQILCKKYQSCFAVFFFPSSKITFKEYFFWFQQIAFYTGLTKNRLEQDLTFPFGNNSFDTFQYTVKKFVQYLLMSLYAL